MTNSKNTRRALMTSALAIFMCFAMLIGTTFAWFTDTASTAVNKIQAGTLDVALEMKNADGEWVNAEGETLDFKKAADAPAGEEILWEPGCTYELPELRVVNKGDLALKYKIIISGIKGNAKLNEVIDWTIGDVAQGTEQKLPAGENNEFIIKGHMKEDAGNEYQGLSIDGIAITVVATQDTVEYDSNNNTYDALAQYPVYKVTNVEVTNTLDNNGKVTATKVAEEKVIETDEKVSTTAGEVSTATATVPADTVLNAGATQITLSITNTDEVADGTTVTETQLSKSFEIKMEGVSEENTEPITVEFYIEAGLTGVVVYHNGVAMTTTGDEYYTYDAESGKVTVVSKSFSPFDVVYDMPVVTNAGTSDELIEALKNGGTIIVNKAISFDGDDTHTYENKNLDLQLEKAGYVHLKLNNTVTTNENVSGYGWGLIRVLPGTKLTISGDENGKFINTMSNSIINVCGGNVVVDSGYFESTSNIFFYYTDVDSAIAAMSLTINGGTFKAAEEVVSNSARLPDDNIVINGGTFYGWNPGNFVDENHQVTTTTEGETTIYTVTAK